MLRRAGYVGAGTGQKRLPGMLHRGQRDDVPAERHGGRPDREHPDLPLPGRHRQHVVAAVHQPGREALDDQPMELEETLLGIGIAERVSYDAERNILFLNLEGLHVRNRDDVDRVRRVVEERCQTIGKKVALVVNYDNFLIDSAVSDTYAAMVRYMETHYYTTASRYTTSAFLRLKLGEALARRRVAPHIFETADEAHAFVEVTDAKSAPGHAA